MSYKQPSGSATYQRVSLLSHTKQGNFRVSECGVNASN